MGREEDSQIRGPGVRAVSHRTFFAANNITPFPAVFGHEVSGVVAQVGPDVTHSASAIMSLAR